LGSIISPRAGLITLSKAGRLGGIISDELPEAGDFTLQLFDLCCVVVGHGL
jgi:hypothetical protein